MSSKMETTHTAVTCEAGHALDVGDMVLVPAIVESINPDDRFTPLTLRTMKSSPASGERSQMVLHGRQVVKCPQPQPSVPPLTDWHDSYNQWD